MQDKKMIEIEVKFWTTGIKNSEQCCKRKDGVLAWGRGYAQIKRDTVNGVKPSRVFFRRDSELMETIEKVLKKSHIHLVRP